MFIDNDTNEIILHHPLERILKKKLNDPVGPDQLLGTKYSVYKRTIPDCDYSTHTAIDDGFTRVSNHEVVQKWFVRPKTDEELRQDEEARLMKLSMLK